MFDIQEHIKEKLGLLAIIIVNIISSLLLTLVLIAAMWLLEKILELFNMKDSLVAQTLSVITEIEAFIFFGFFVLFGIHSLWKLFSAKKEMED